MSYRFPVIALLLVSALCASSCKMFKGKKEQSSTTGWNYNDPDQGGYEVKHAAEQETGPDRKSTRLNSSH